MMQTRVIIGRSSTAFIACFILFVFLFSSSCGPTDANEETVDPEPTEYTLDVSVVPEGAGVTDPDSGSFVEGSEVEIAAVPESGWVFKQWKGGVTSEENPLFLTMNEDISLEAEFVRSEYVLTVNIEGEGEVEQSIITEKSDNYEEGTLVQLIAQPAEGWQFSEWQGDLSGSENPESIRVDEEKEVTALFTRKEYSLTTEIDGEGSVTEEFLSGGQTENGYLFESEIRLTAESAEGWTFSGWEGDVESEENPVTVTILDDTDVRAIFEKQGFTLTVLTNGEGNVDQEIVQPKTTNYAYETVVELTALPSNGWEFNEWQGVLSGTENPQTIEILQDSEVTAFFNRKEFSMQLDTDGEGVITQTLLSGEETENGYLFESQVELEAVTDENWHFSGWQGDISSDENPLIVDITENIELMAVFEPVDYTFSIQKEGDGNVTVDLISGDQTEDGYSYGSELEISANPEEGWEFSEWSGDISSTENPVSVIVEGDLSVTALFTTVYYALDLEHSGNGAIEKQLISGEVNEVGEYIHGTEVELKALPDDGWMFSEWNGDLDGNENPTEIVMNGDKSVTAEFDTLSLEYSVDLVFEDSKGQFEMEFGQASDPASLRRLAPPPPPAGALNAYFVYNGENYVRDYRSDSETSITWELHYKPGDGENLSLTWNLNPSDIEGNLILTNEAGDFEIDMLEEQPFDLPDEQDGVLIIQFTVNH